MARLSLYGKYPNQVVSSPWLEMLVPSPVTQPLSLFCVRQPQAARSQQTRIILIWTIFNFLLHPFPNRAALLWPHLEHCCSASVAGVQNPAVTLRTATVSASMPRKHTERTRFVTCSRF